MGTSSPPHSSSSSSQMSKCKEARRYLPATVAWALLLSTTSLFFIFPARWFYDHHNIWIPIGEGFIALIVIANFTLATFMDPGVIPKASRGEDDNDDLRAPLYKTVDVQGINVRMKWCVTCQFYRPPRCSHCSVCNNCIETFDHHCPWVNNCIGRRNYRFFFMFLMSLSIHMISIFSLCLIFLLQHMEKVSELRTIICISIMVVICVLIIPICGLSGFHIVLVYRGRTTNEQVTGKYRGGYNPFSRGCCYNCWFTLCGPLYPGLVRAKKNNSENVGVVYHTPGQVESGLGGGNQVKTYMDNGAHNKKSSGLVNLPSLHSPRDYRQMIPSRYNGEHELGLQASQSLDCEPTPPMQRQGSKTNFFLPSKEMKAEEMGRNVRGLYSHGSPHPNRQRSGVESRSRSETPESPPEPIVYSSPVQQKIRQLGGVLTPFAPPSPSPLLPRRSNPPTPTHPHYSYTQNNIIQSSVQHPLNPYERQLGMRESGLRELASSPQRSLYQWKDNSPKGNSPTHHEGGSNGSYAFYAHSISSPTSPAHLSTYSSPPNLSPPGPYHGGGGGGGDYERGGLSRRPVSFVRALEMSEGVGPKGVIMNSTPIYKPQSSQGGDRASVYDMNYEISV